MKNLLILMFSLFCLPFNIAAQVEFTIKTPTIVAVNEPFRVEFISNETIDDFTAPSFDGFNVIAGPTIAEGTNIEYVNGKLSKSQSFTYTYVLVAQKEGNTKIGEAVASINGKKYTTKSVPIDVAKERGSSNGSSQQGVRGSGNGTSQKPSSSIASDDVLLRTIVGRRTVYKGEPILVQLKLYTRAQISNISSFRPAAFNGFWKQEVPTSEQQETKRETFNGKIYDTAVVKEFLVFPQKSGQLEIEQMDLGVIAMVLSAGGRSGNSIFESFFGGGDSYQNVELNLKSIPVKIEVKELPSGAPATFNGAVGDFSVDGQLSENKISANGSATIFLTIKGSGNFPLISTPKVELPGSFELYPSKTKDEYQVNTTNIAGSRVFEYPFIARAEGEFTLPSVEFSYFDPAKHKYVTIATPTFPIDVLKDVSGGSSAGGNIIS
ncbi:MAG: BatD family protein, partial [Rikenellaceae bacterium]